MQDDAEQRRMHGRQPPAQGAGRDAFRDAIAHEEARLATLEAQQAESRHRLAARRAELAALEAQPEIRVRSPLSLEAPIPRTSADKVRLFRSFFRGREDVFPIRFESRKTGKSGYDGEAFLQHLAARNRVIVVEPEGRACTADFVFKPQSRVLPIIGPVRCHFAATQ